MVASLIGIFPKIILEFGPLTQAQLEVVAPILDSSRQSVTYYDPVKKTNITMQTYTGDWETSNKGTLNTGHKNGSFSCSFISVKKRA